MSNIKNLKRTDNIAHIVTFLGLTLTAVSSAIPLWWDQSVEHKGIYDNINATVNVITLGTFLLSGWSQKKLSDLSKRKEKIMEVKINKAHLKIERFKNETAKYKLEYEKIKAHLAWRDISQENAKRLYDLLTRSHARYSIILNASDPEIRRYGDMIIDITSKAGCLDRVYDMPDIKYAGLVLTGKNMQYIYRIQKCLEGAGIDVTIEDTNVYIGGDVSLYIGPKVSSYII